MLSRIIEFSVRQRSVVYLTTLLLVGAGIWSALRLPIDAVPDITNVQVQVNTAVPALAPEEIERSVTAIIENELSGIPGMTDLRSLSKFGLSQVNLVFEDGTDIFRARQLAGERLQNIQDELPAGLTPRLAPISTGLGDIFYYAVDYAPDAKNIPATRKEQLMALKLIQDFIVKPRLRATPGVAEINTSGGYEKQIIVSPDPQKLSGIGVTFAELAKVVSENVENAGGGVIQLGGEQVAVRAAGRVQNIEDIKNLPLKFSGRAELFRVRDVATVDVGTEIRTGASTWNGRECVLGGAMMLAGENSRLVAKAVAENIIEIQKRLPPGVVITPLYDRMVLVDKTISTVEKNLFEGAIFVIAVLLLLLGNWRAAIIVSLAIPLSLLFAMTGMIQGKISGNLMSLGAIDFGLIVDGSVVMVENIVRRLAHKQKELGRRLTPEERTGNVITAAKEVCSPMFFGVLIITIVYVPILALTGIEGKTFKPMALTVIFALVGSLALALALMPALCAKFLSGNNAEKDSLFMRLAKRFYEPALRLALRFRLLTIAGAVAIFVYSIFTYNKLGAEFVPQLDEGSFAVHMIRTTGIGIDASVSMQEESDKALLEKFPEIDYVFTRIGTAEIATDPMGVNVSDVYIFFKPQETWRKIAGAPATKEQLATLMSQELSARFPAQAYLFSQPIEMRFNEILEGTRADIAVKIFGENFDELEKLATEAREILEKIPGAADVEFDALGKTPLLEIVPRRDAIARYNLHADEINRVVSDALAGGQTGMLYDGNLRYPIIVRLPEEQRRDTEIWKQLPVRTDDGGLLLLGQIADFKVSEQVAAIAREYGQRRVAVMVNLRGRDVDGFVREAQEKLNAGLSLPAGYTLEFGGQFKNLTEAKARLAIVVPAALGLILILIYATLRSFRQTLIVFTAVPLAVSGGVFALWIREIPFSISAGVGFIALSGIAVLNGLMIITFFNQLRAAGADVKTAVWDGSLLRLRPKLMTALVASLGFIPPAIATGAGAEVQRPLATVVIGGIITATFLTLIVVPALYSLVERDKSNSREK